MSQSPSPAGGEKPGFGGFFQVYLLAAVILMIYYTIDFQVTVSPALPALTARPSASRPHPPRFPQAGQELPVASSSVAGSVPTAVSTPASVLPQDPASPAQPHEPPTPSPAPASSPAPEPEPAPPAPPSNSEHQAPSATSEPTAPAGPERTDAASGGLLIIDNTLPLAEPVIPDGTPEPSPASPEPPSTPDALPVAHLDGASPTQLSPAKDTEEPATSSSLPEVGQ
ncbi:MAG TPA: hypothetical protein PLU72_04705 [Candidatus Ozemobacteraceae bacterium]|nr:hypothetical protein [Candidatus Ozemobacteraceae bacterium]